MKYNRSQVHCKIHAIPELRFQKQQLTSFSGLVIFQIFFSQIQLIQRLRDCLKHLKIHSIYGHANILMQMVIHLLLGFRDLRHCLFYKDDPMVKRILGLQTLPNVSTVSRVLASLDSKAIENLRRMIRDLILQRLEKLALARVTLDFDGSVLSTSRSAQGSAVGFNKKKKGARSYYPLFCTLAQTGQVFDFLHRAGNVHDSNGAKGFILECIEQIQSILPATKIEVRMDSAFFSDDIVSELKRRSIEFSISVPFERFTILKHWIENRGRWLTLDQTSSYFETDWKPQSWSDSFRFLFIRTKTKEQKKGPVQLDLFVPYTYGFEYKVILTNKQVGVQTVLAYHNGRGSQEGIFAETKSQLHMGYVPSRRLVANQAYLCAGILAHNLVRELQMTVKPQKRRTTKKRACLWMFEKVDTYRKTFIQKAGKLTSPSGKLTLTMNANKIIQKLFLEQIQQLKQAA